MCVYKMERTTQRMTTGTPLIIILISALAIACLAILFLLKRNKLAVQRNKVLEQGNKTLAQKLRTSGSDFQDQIDVARTEAEDARKTQEKFLANMSHEIRTPMNGIQGMTKLLLETTLTPQQKEFTAIINRSVDNLLDIINDILDFSRIRAGKLTIEKIDFRLQDVITNVRSLFDNRLRKKGLLLDVDMA